MPTITTLHFTGTRLDPVINPREAEASILPVKLVANATYAAGTVLGEVTASPGTYKAYASANVDGSQNPALILKYATTTDASGNITNYSEWGGSASGAPAYIKGVFRIEELTGMDANAVTKMAARILQGALGSTGLINF